jgi:hypothetical protein
MEFCIFHAAWLPGAGRGLVAGGAAERHIWACGGPGFEKNRAAPPAAEPGRLSDKLLSDHNAEALTSGQDRRAARH